MSRRKKVPGKLRRVFYFGPHIDEAGYGSGSDLRYECSGDRANLVSSEIHNGSGARGGDSKARHAVAIDIDVPAWLVPSSTKGHSHLYIDKEMTWPQYAAILQALADAGIIEDGYLAASFSRGATFLRPPGVQRKVARP